ncbi:MAG: hypothetical protein OXO48_15120 [Caldilineaceae bacterium]|nr:hypothetical protein [Caldilineaceae bacterium]
MTRVQRDIPVADRSSFATSEDVASFFRACDELEGPGAEPDWSEHLRVVNSSRADIMAGINSCRYSALHLRRR